jgi:uncharacterized membrane protein YraQ (UPF0718 family)
MPLRFRRPPLTYLRRLALAIVVLVGVVAAACFPPAVVLPRVVAFADALARTWFYFCSMLLGAAPFLMMGAFAGAIAGRAGFAFPLFAILFPGCDCSMNAYAASLRRFPPCVSALAIVWGSCCNPIALFSTATVLGPHMVVNRVIVGAVAATLTAILWSRLPVTAPESSCEETHIFWDSFIQRGGSGIASFAVSAFVSAAYISLLAKSMHPAGAVTAALLGAVLSPCSSADAILARVLFTVPANQLIFIVAAQCLDVRQMYLLHRTFGMRHAALAFCAAATACLAGWAFLER